MWPVLRVWLLYLGLRLGGVCSMKPGAPGKPSMSCVRPACLLGVGRRGRKEAVPGSSRMCRPSLLTGKEQGCGSSGWAPESRVALHWEPHFLPLLSSKSAPSSPPWKSHPWALCSLHRCMARGCCPWTPPRQVHTAGPEQPRVLPKLHSCCTAVALIS